MIDALPDTGEPVEGGRVLLALAEFGLPKEAGEALLQTAVDQGDVLVFANPETAENVFARAPRFCRGWVPPKLARERSARRSSIAITGWVAWKRREGDEYGALHATTGGRRALCGAKIPQVGVSTTWNPEFGNFCKGCAVARAKSKSLSRMLSEPRATPRPPIGASARTEMRDRG